MKANELSNLLKSNGIKASNTDIEKAISDSGQNLRDLTPEDITPEFINYLKKFLPASAELSTDVLNGAIEVGFLDKIDDYVEASLEDVSDFETYVSEAHQMMAKMRVERVAPLIYKLAGNERVLTGDYVSQEQQLIEFIEAETLKLKNRPKAADRLAALKAKIAS